MLNLIEKTKLASGLRSIMSPGVGERSPIQVEERDVSSTEQSREILRQLGLIEGGANSFQMPVSERTAINIMSVWAAVRYLSDTIAMLPTTVIERVSEKESIKHHDHPVAEFLRSPCQEYPEYTCTQTLLASANLHGNGVGIVEKSKNRIPTNLRIMDARTFNVRYLNDHPIFPKNLVYEFPYSGKQGFRFAPNDIIHIRSLCMPGQLKGISPVRNAARTLGITIAGENYNGHLYAGGAKPAGIVQVPTAMGDVAYERFKESLDRMLDRLRSDPGSISNTPLILEEGATFNPWSMTAEDVQLLMTRRFQIEEIARMYRVPPHKIGSLEKSSFNNIEQQNIDAVTDSLQPWVIQVQQEFTRKLIHPNEQGRFSVHLDLSGVLRGDFKSRTEGYKNLAAMGALSADEARNLEHLNPLDDGMGARPRVPVNTMPIPDETQADKHVEKIVNQAETPKENAPGVGDGTDGGKD